MKQGPKEPTPEIESLQAETSKEAEKLPAILFIYRDNGLFQSIMPEIQSQLETLGRKVEIKKFEQGMSWRKIGEQLKEDYPELSEGKQVVTDGTIHRTLRNYRVERDELYEGQYLDETLDEITFKVILDDESELKRGKRWDKLERGSDQEYTERGMIKIFKRIMEDEESRPNFVKIKKKKLLDHFPFKKLSSEDEAVDKITEWLKQAGIPEEVIVRKEDFTAILEGLTRENYPKVTWEISDRHTGKVDQVVYDDTLGRALFLQLPLSTLYQSSQEAGLLKLKPEEIEKYRDLLKEKLEEKFGFKENKD